MKIAYIVPALATGGAERVTVALARHAAQAGHDVTIFVGWPAPPERALPRTDLPPDVAVELMLTANPGKLSGYVLGLSWVLQHRERLFAFDIVHCHLTFAAVVGSALQLLRDIGSRRLPVIVETYHAVGTPVRSPLRQLHRFMAARRDLLVRMAPDPSWDAFAANHPRLLSRVIRNGAEDPLIHTVTSDQRAAQRKRFGIPEGSLVVGTVGRLNADRQPWIYIPVFAEIRRVMGPGVHFLLAGGGSEEARLHTLLSLQGLEGQVHITGSVAEPRQVLALMDAYVTMNVGPICGLAGLEAALAGHPVVGVQLQADYVSGPDEWLWTSADPLALAHRLIALLQDASARRALGQKQQEHVRNNFTNRAMWAAYATLYDEALALSKHHR